MKTGVWHGLNPNPRGRIPLEICFLLDSHGWLGECLSVSKRPSETTGPVEEVPNRASDSYWRSRLFRNSFTRGGERHELDHWYVKIQHQGRRRTFRLRSADPDLAAAEARQLFAELSTVGWTQTLAEREKLLASGRRGVGLGLVPQSSADYWRERLIFRRYMEDVRPGISSEYSIRIEHDGVFHYFPLGTSDETVAAQKARDIHHEVLTQGWAFVRSRITREITIAIYWSLNPVACTYASYLTSVETRRESSVDDLEPRFPVLILETEPEVGSALEQWVDQQPLFRCGDVVKQPDELLARVWPLKKGMVLIDRNLPRSSASEIIERVRILRPDIPCFLFGGFSESDSIFASMSGVGAGYMFKRTPPRSLFEPIGVSSAADALDPEVLRSRVRKFFQALFEDSQQPETRGEQRHFTFREHEILVLLSKGFVDKEIANSLNVSVWTVHNHLKKIYQKLGVHNRTEAVVKFLRR